MEESAHDSRDWWLATYGPIDPARDSRATRVREVFDRMATAMDRRDARLVMVGAAGDPYAVALPDGSVVLTVGALDFCYGPLRARKPALEHGDLRLAFVVGHELAHLAADFRNRAAFAAAERFSGAGNGQRSELGDLVRLDPRDSKRDELDADFAGVTAMAMAGYSAAELFRNDPDFFTLWASQSGLAGADDDRRHPKPADRDKFAQSLLTGWAEEHDFFHFGVRLAELGKYEDAIALLERFGRVFPGREVSSNVGYARYQLAVKALAACDGALAVRFRLPVTIDDETLAARSRLRGGSSPCLASGPARDRLDDARKILEKVTDSDPGYLPAHRNLLAVEIVSGLGAAAMAQAEETLKVAPGDAATLIAKGVATYLFGIESRIETLTDRALDLLAEAASDPRREADAVFNRAVILSERGRNARKAWERFLVLEPHGPYADLARERLGKPAEKRAVAVPSARLPIPLGTVGPATGAALRKMESRAFDFANMSVRFYWGRGLSVLQINDAVELVEQSASKTTPRLPAGAVVPPVRVETQRGVLLRYPGLAFDLEDERVRAVVYFEPSR